MRFRPIYQMQVRTFLVTFYATPAPPGCRGVATALAIDHNTF